MCVKCGNSKPHQPLAKSSTAQLYTGPGGPVADIPDDHRGKALKWGPITWLSLGVSGLLLGLIVYASTL
jgi:hypothetical protein